jgi:sulfur-oxidizing protein SoxY
MSTVQPRASGAAGAGTRRIWLRQAGGLGAAALIGALPWQSAGAQWATDPAYQAAEARAQQAIAAFLRSQVPETGRVALDIAELVENGNTVPLRVAVASPMTAADHVREIALFTHRNPQPEVAVFHLGPHNGRAEVATRIRLATSQRITAIARMADGRCWLQRADVIVTLAACVES